MKRLNNLFDKVYDISNIYLADIKARKDKSRRYGVKLHDKHKESDNNMLSSKIRNGEYKTSEYTTYKIYEPKERVIYRLPYYPDRITHHAIMNIMEPIWVNIFTRDTYSCIKNRGIHALAKKLKSDLSKYPDQTKYCAKMDIKKFYPSIDHDILKGIIRKKIKDNNLLQLLDEIIDSTEGVPIGNYLSQYFANLYMAYFDHWVKEELKVKFYYRYADDIVLLGNDKNQLRNWILAIKVYLTNVLKLKLKDNYQIYPVDSRGIDFVGYIFYHTHTLLRKSIKKRLFKLIDMYQQKKITKEQLKTRITSYFGWLKYCNSKNLLKKIQDITGISYSNWNGDLVNITSFYKKVINIVNIERRNKYFIVQFIYNNKPYYFKSKNKKLFNTLLEYDRKTKINNQT